jgi:hypothetical protein
MNRLENAMTTPTPQAPERRRSSQDDSPPADVQRALARLERAAWLWRGRRHSLPGDGDAEVRPLSLLPPRR